MSRRREAIKFTEKKRVVVFSPVTPPTDEEIFAQFSKEVGNSRFSLERTSQSQKLGYQGSGGKVPAKISLNKQQSEENFPPVEEDTDVLLTWPPRKLEPVQAKDRRKTRRSKEEMDVFVSRVVKLWEQFHDVWTTTELAEFLDEPMGNVRSILKNRGLKMKFAGVGRYAALYRAGLSPLSKNTDPS